MKRRNFTVAILALGWILGTYQGRIALWQEGNARPIRIFPYSAAALPREDQLALEKGIAITTREDLQHLLEDYLS